MKILLSTCLALALSLAAFAQSQDQSSGQGSQATQGSQSQSQTDTKASAGKNMSGTVSHDAKSVKSDSDNKKYKVDNPDALKGKEDQHIAMVVAVDPDTNTIHIIQVQQPQ
jgi:opacity protein-like surface antigen